MMININRTGVFAICTAFALGAVLGFTVEKNRISRKLVEVLFDRLNNKEEDTA